MPGRTTTLLAVLPAVALTIGGSSLCCRAGEPARSDAGKERAKAAQQTYEWWAADFVNGTVSLDTVYRWSHRWMEAELYVARGQVERLSLTEAHLARMRAAQKLVGERTASGRNWLESFLGVEHYCAESELWVADARAGQLGPATTKEASVARLATARLIYQDWRNRPPYPDIFQGRLKSPDPAYYWSRRWLEAELAVASKRTDGVAAVEGYRERAQEVEKLVKDAVRAEKASLESVAEATFYRADAELLLATWKADARDDKAEEAAAKIRLDAAKATYESFAKEFRSIEQMYMWSNRWREAALATASTHAERVAASEAHLARMKELQKSMKKLAKASRVPAWYVWATDFYCADAQILCSEAKTKR